MSTSTVTASTSRSELYVDITRGRSNNQLYGTRPVDEAGDLDEHLPRLQHELTAILRHRLARNPPHTALATDPDAPTTARAGHGRTLAGLVAARRRGDRSAELVRTIEEATAAIRRIAAYEPPRRLTNVLPAMPKCPHLAARWRQTAGDVAVYVAAYASHTRPDQTGLPALIGSHPPPDDAPDWDRVADTICTTAVAIIYRQLIDRADATHDTELATIIGRQPDWLTWHLHRLARSGGLASPNLASITTTIREVHQWRIEHSLVDNTAPDAPLGPVPQDPAQRSRHSALRHRLTVRTSTTTTRGIA